MDINLDEDFWESDDLAIVAENNLLDHSFSKDEIKEVVFYSYADGAQSRRFLLFCFIKKIGKPSIKISLTCLGILRRMKLIYLESTSPCLR
jgi:hypothetical protein